MSVRAMLLSSAVLLATPLIPASKPDLAVLEKRAGYVGFYTLDGQRIAQAKVGSFPHEGVLSPDRRLLYVTDNGVLWLTDEGDGGNTVSIIDVAAMKKVGEIALGQFRRPHGIALAPTAGRLLVTTEKPPRLLLVDAVRRTVLRDYDVQGKNPHMVTVGPDGEWAFVSNTESGTVAAVHLSSGRMQLLNTAARPQGGVLSRDGSILYVTNTGGGRITLIDPRKPAVKGEITIGMGAGRIALTPDGKTLVYNLQQDEGVGFVDIASRKQVTVIPLGGQPLSLSLSRDGKYAFSGVQAQDKIFVISVAERKILRVIPAPKDAGPDPAISLM